MSVQHLTWAFRINPKSKTQKLALLALANYANEDGACFPGQQRLANDTNCSIATVRRALKELESKK